MHGEISAEFPLVPQLPQRKLLQDVTAAPSTYPHNTGLLTLIDTFQKLIQSMISITHNQDGELLEANLPNILIGKKGLNNF